MHGRLKIKTTAEQEEEKKKERNLKCQKYSAGMRQILENKHKLDMQDVVLTLTETLLSGNPDVYTLWNIRKEILLNMSETRSPSDMSNSYNHELKFLQSCLHVNPKSYGVWSHRRFCMDTMPCPDWKEELRLCGLFLDYDSRNFHCWDYRRYVVQKAGVDAELEFAFTAKKIQDNFSNYSAWHNRTKLLPVLYPSKEEGGKVEESALLKEFQLAQNAFFTDPNDQSAWFYQRWLLGRKVQESRLLSCAMYRQRSLVVLSFSQPVCRPGETVTLHVGENQASLPWLAASADEKERSLLSASAVWLAKVDFPDRCLATLHVPAEDRSGKRAVDVTMTKDESVARYVWTADDSGDSIFSDSHTAAKVSVLQEELEACRALLEEEPDNKWTILTIVFLMRAIDGSRFVGETERFLEKLIAVDAMRAGYYKDLRSKYRLEDKLQAMLSTRKDLVKVTLQGMGLTRLHYINYLACVEQLDLSGNYLTDYAFLSLMPALKELAVDAEAVEFLVSCAPDGVQVVAATAQL